jgi:hypothetical protein
MRYAGNPICQIKQPARPQIRGQSHYSKQPTPIKFSWLFVWFVVKKWVADDQSASSLSMRLAVKLLQSRRDDTMSNPRWSCAEHCGTWGGSPPNTTPEPRGGGTILVPPLRGFGGGGMPCPRFRFASPGVTHGATPPALDASGAIA